MDMILDYHALDLLLDLELWLVTAGVRSQIQVAELSSLPYGDIPDTPNKEEAVGKIQNTPKGLNISSGLAGNSPGFSIRS